MWNLSVSSNDLQIEFHNGAAANLLQVVKFSPSGTVPGTARVALTLGCMMFQFEQAGNGEGLENRGFTCIVVYSELAEKSGLIDRPRRDVELQPLG